MTPGSHNGSVGQRFTQDHSYYTRSTLSRLPLIKPASVQQTKLSVFTLDLVKAYQKVGA